MSYYISKTLNSPFDAVVAEVTARLKEQGFGVLTDIDVQSTLKAKIGVDMAKASWVLVTRASRTKPCRSRTSSACCFPAT